MKGICISGARSAISFFMYACVGVFVFMCKCLCSSGRCSNSLLLCLASCLPRQRHAYKFLIKLLFCSSSPPPPLLSLLLFLFLFYLVTGKRIDCPLTRVTVSVCFDGYILCLELGCYILVLVQLPVHIR